MAVMTSIGSIRKTVQLFTAFYLLVTGGLVPGATLISTYSPNVVGNFQLVSEQGITRHIEFQATKSMDGRVAGEIIFRDDAPINVEKTSEDASGESSQPFFFKADIDCLVINERKAILSGSIKESSSKPYIGRRILVVALDNGGANDPSKRDRVTWGVYRADRKDWAASDAERPDEQINQLSWIATDSERVDDEGVSSDQETVIGCKSFPLSAFSFFTGNQIRGTVVVKP